ncbi:ubiquitin-like-conjugating enzyme ATG10 isoform X2 [Contarinia nasturtii]|uniref:ubiquitin-like-conjugating enzyme ATG10 isoform X2 n=1 Tax=Contarinia nasturtii TaxID=265458 RepID=UPI0012D4541E|nr:ubiquitin-like-conjugating enzyme ATG10 isoform X2 [Contarinia nasturtii]
MNGISWEHFLCDIKQIQNISQHLNDDWEIVSVNNEVSGTYLTKTISLPFAIEGGSNEIIERTIQPPNKFEEEDYLSFESPSQASNSITKQLLKFEYHVLYHISYAVPYLCFNAYKSNGSLLTLDEAWKIFNDFGPLKSNPIQQNMLNILTQMEHPILFKPFLTLHPCRIAEVLHSLPHSQNKVLSFLSSYGPTIYLTFDLEDVIL